MKFTSVPAAGHFFISQLVKKRSVRIERYKLRIAVGKVSNPLNCEIIMAWLGGCTKNVGCLELLQIEKTIANYKIHQNQKAGHGWLSLMSSSRHSTGSLDGSEGNSKDFPPGSHKIKVQNRACTSHVIGTFNLWLWEGAQWGCAV